jgi:hypothetical protein
MRVDHRNRKFDLCPPPLNCGVCHYSPPPPTTYFLFFSILCWLQRVKSYFFSRFSFLKYQFLQINIDPIVKSFRMKAVQKYRCYKSACNRCEQVGIQRQCEYNNDILGRRFKSHFILGNKCMKWDLRFSRRWRCWDVWLLSCNAVRTYRYQHFGGKYIPPKRWYLPTSPHGVTTQNISIDKDTKFTNITTLVALMFVLDTNILV